MFFGQFKRLRLKFLIFTYLKNLSQYLQAILNFKPLHSLFVFFKIYKNQ